MAERRIVFNGQEYPDAGAMPPETRRAYEQALEQALAQLRDPNADPAPVDGARGSHVSFHVRERFVVNGREYESLDEIPEGLRSAIRAAMESRGGPSSAGTGAAPTGREAPEEAGLEQVLMPGRAAGKGRTPGFVKGVLAGVALVVAVWLVLKAMGLF